MSCEPQIASPAPATRDAEQLFRRHFGRPPVHVVRAPGRLELLGNHTDYNDGLVLALAIDRYVQLAATPRTDGRITLVSSAFPAPETFSAHAPVKNPTAPWADYVKGVLDQLRRRGAPMGGFDAAIHGTIPLGAGLSSSAALLVATALTVRQMFPYTLTATGLAPPPYRDPAGKVPPPTNTERWEIAKLCQAAENQFVGVNCGLLDHVTSLFGRASHALEIDCQSLTVEPVPVLGEVAVIVCDTGVKHALVEGEYNALRAACESAARRLGVKSLRAAELSMIRGARAKLSEREFECASHVVGEIQRVVFGSRALRDGDFETFGQYLFQSHASSRDLLRNSSPELDALVTLAREHASCLGARLTGGGFGGATLHLVRRSEAAEYQQYLARTYSQHCGRSTQPMRCEIVNGAA